jgi:hypothetical protein
MTLQEVFGDRTEDRKLITGAGGGETEKRRGADDQCVE